MRKISSIIVAVFACCASIWGQGQQSKGTKIYEVDAGQGIFHLWGKEDGESGECSKEQIAALIEKDVFGYFKLNDEYSTPLQKNAFKKTEEYAKYLSTLEQDYNRLMASNFGIFYDLRYNNPYDVENKCFTFSIWIEDWKRVSFPNYIGLGDNINTTFPARYLKVRKEREYNGELYSKQYLRIPVADEGLALKIEKDMASPHCSTCLLFVVRLNKVVTEKHPDFYWALDNILAKTTNLYIINKETMEVYCDLSNIL